MPWHNGLNWVGFLAFCVTHFRIPCGFFSHSFHWKKEKKNKTTKTEWRPQHRASETHQSLVIIRHTNIFFSRFCSFVRFFCWHVCVDYLAVFEVFFKLNVYCCCSSCSVTSQNSNWFLQYFGTFCPSTALFFTASNIRAAQRHPKVQENLSKSWLINWIALFLLFPASHRIAFAKTWPTNTSSSTKWQTHCQLLSNPQKSPKPSESLKFAHNYNTSCIAFLLPKNTQHLVKIEWKPNTNNKHPHDSSRKIKMLIKSLNWHKTISPWLAFVWHSCCALLLQHASSHGIIKTKQKKNRAASKLEKLTHAPKTR